MAQQALGSLHRAIQAEPLHPEHQYLMPSALLRVFDNGCLRSVLPSLSPCIKRKRSSQFPELLRRRPLRRPFSDDVGRVPALRPVQLH